MKTANEIIFDFIGIPVGMGMTTRSGHGYSAYVCTDNTTITDVIRSLSIWGGSTKTFINADGIEYKFYEIDCRDKEFFKSNVFERICNHKVKITIYEESNDELIKFKMDLKMLR